MATNRIPAHVLQAYLAQTPPDTEVDLNKIAAEIQEAGMQQALTFFSTLEECIKVKYLMFLYNYYYHALTDGSYLWEPTESFSEEFIVEIEDQFIIKYNLDTTSLVAIRRLVSRLQKEVAKQRVYKKEEVVEVMSDNTDS
jgi:hypothetical protein